MTPKPRSTTVLLVAVGALVAGAALAGESAESGESPPAPRVEWDQERVTTLAKELNVATRSLRQAVRNQPPGSFASGEARARTAFADMLRRIEHESKHLVAELEAGKGHDETLPVFENLLQMVRAARIESQRVFLQGQAVERIEVARAVLARLDPYYDNAHGIPAEPRR